MIDLVLDTRIGQARWSPFTTGEPGNADLALQFLQPELRLEVAGRRVAFRDAALLLLALYALWKGARG